MCSYLQAQTCLFVLLYSWGELYGCGNTNQNGGNTVQDRVAL